MAREEEVGRMRIPHDMIVKGVNEYSMSERRWDRGLSNAQTATWVGGITPHGLCGDDDVVIGGSLTEAQYDYGSSLT